MAAPPTIALGADLADAVARVSTTLRAGGVVVVPTDTVYGLAALPGDAAAMSRLFALKGRGPRVPVAVLCSDAEQALALTASPVVPEVRAAAARWWPGPLTLVLPRRLGLHLHLGAPATTVGVRVPDDALVRAVAAEVGPVAATSANRHGEPTPVSVAEVVAALGAGVDLLVDGGDLTAGASTVVDVTRAPWRVLREGPIPAPDLLALAPEA